MRFFLDQNVDVAVGHYLGRRGHQWWTADDAGLSSDDDDDLSVYAHNRGAVVVSHDIKFAERRRKNTIGKHLWLRCDEFDAVEVLTLYREEVERRLEARSDIVVTVSRDGVRSTTSWQ